MCQPLPYFAGLITLLAHTCVFTQEKSFKVQAGEQIGVTFDHGVDTDVLASFVQKLKGKSPEASERMQKLELLMAEHVSFVNASRQSLTEDLEQILEIKPLIRCADRLEKEQERLNKRAAIVADTIEELLGPEELNLLIDIGLQMKRGGPSRAIQYRVGNFTSAQLLQLEKVERQYIPRCLSAFQPICESKTVEDFQKKLMSEVVRLQWELTADRWQIYTGEQQFQEGLYHTKFLGYPDLRSTEDFIQVVKSGLKQYGDSVVSEQMEKRFINIIKPFPKKPS